MIARAVFVFILLVCSADAFGFGFGGNKGPRIVKNPIIKGGNSNFGNNGNNNIPPGFGLNSNADGGGDGQSSSALGAFLASYDAAAKKNPYLIKGLTSLFGFLVGDLLAQKFIDKADSIDIGRVLRLASFGFLIHGPTGHVFYGFLDGKMPGTSAITVASKVAIDQILWNPIFGVMFFTYMTLAEGKTLEDVKSKIQNDLFTAVRGSWTVWPVAHAINFRFIGTDQRLLYINSVQIFYNMFLSFIANKGGSDE
mmetsp:Transcript_28958/g.50255  ORF Transcript_28958/g.50255 Transcript_28958/m.50255 type:complete len:253 (-) Transcript_28958:436-1194(-)